MVRSFETFSIEEPGQTPDQEPDPSERADFLSTIKDIRDLQDEMEPVDPNYPFRVGTITPFKTIETQVEETPIVKPTTRHSFMPMSMEDAKDKALGLLQGIKSFGDGIPSHTHTKDGIEYVCTDLGCNWKFWHHPEVEEVMNEYPELGYWVARDPVKFNSLVQLSQRKRAKAVDGYILKIGKRRIQLSKLVNKVLLPLIGSTSIGTIIMLLIGG